MSAALARRDLAGPGLGVVLAAGGLVAVAWLDPIAAARGWLAGWFLALSISTGAAALILIHALTGGCWRMAGEPWLTAAASVTPVLALGGVATALTHGLLYPWAGGGEGGSVEAFYLNASFWTVRMVTVLLVWAGLGFLARRGPGGVAAAWGLVLYGITISVAGLDWLLSLDPDFTSTDFGAQMAITQIACALALPAVLGLTQQPPSARADWGGLLLAALLGAFYLVGMQFLVSWSGDLPDKAAWYLARNRGAGLALAWAILLLGIVAPFAILLRTAWRGETGRLRIAGALVLCGALGHLVWIVAPLSDPAALPALPAALFSVWLLASVARLLRPGGAR